MSREGLMVCLPQYAGGCISSHMRSVVSLVSAFERGGFPYELQFGSDSAVHRVRYMMTEAFMRSDWGTMVWIDSDIEFEPWHIERLWSLIRGGADVAVGVYGLKRDGAELAAHTEGRLIKVDDLPDEPFEVDYAGTGFMMIKRGTFERIRDVLPMIETDKYGVIPRWWSFDVTDGVELPEDYGFCKRVRDAGGVVVMDPSVRLRHWGLKGY